MDQTYIVINKVKAPIFKASIVTIAAGNQHKVTQIATIARISRSIRGLILHGKGKINESRVKQKINVSSVHANFLINHMIAEGTKNSVNSWIAAFYLSSSGPADRDAPNVLWKCCTHYSYWDTTMIKKKVFINMASNF